MILQNRSSKNSVGIVSKVNISTCVELRSNNVSSIFNW